MKKQLFLSLFACVLTSALAAQTDVTADYLKNYSFDSGFHHKAGTTTEVKQEIKTITGWTAGFTVDYTITGIYEYGFAGTFNGGEVPAQGYEGRVGGALALSTGWGVEMTYSQNVTLPAGTYTINAPTYNAKSATKGKSLLAWIPQSGDAVVSALNGYPSKTWTLDQITFTLTEETQGKIQIGYKAAENTGSGSSANLLIDYVQILVKSMDESKLELGKTLATANTLYGDGSGRGASDLKAAIDRAQTAYDGSDTPLAEVLAVDEALKAAIETYAWLNASPNAPVDCTERYIQNPSFEIDGTAGWSVLGMSIQTNSYFTKKEGTNYMEAWTSRGSKISEASLSQVLKGLPKGNYRLQAGALHIQQSGQGSTTNTGSPQKGAYLYAGFSKTLITAMKTYAVTFSIVDEQGEVEIGVTTENPTGNYLCVDDFHLQYIGEIGTSDIAKELQSLLTHAESYSSNGMQQPASEGLSLAIEVARQALTGTGTDDGGNTIYDEAALNAAHEALTAAIATAEASVARYTALQERITYATKVLKWWKDITRKANAWNLLDEANATAKELVVDYTLTDDQLKAAVNTLNNRIKAVDKKIYCSAPTRAGAFRAPFRLIVRQAGDILQGIMGQHMFKYYGWSSEPLPSIKSISLYIYGFDTGGDIYYYNGGGTWERGGARRQVEDGPGLAPIVLQYEGGTLGELLIPTDANVAPDSIIVDICHVEVDPPVQPVSPYAMCVFVPISLTMAAANESSLADEYVTQTIYNENYNK